MPVPQGNALFRSMADVHFQNVSGFHLSNGAGESHTRPLFSPTPDAPGVLSIPHDRSFKSAVLMIVGWRGSGKSLLMTNLLKAQQERFEAVGEHRHIWTNYQCSFADIADAFLVDHLLRYRADTANITIGIDEIQSFMANTRATARTNLDFGTFLTQIRKRGIEVVLTTQFPQFVDNRVLTQMNLIIRPSILYQRDHREGSALRLKMYDWWGTYTGVDWKRRRWPPLPWDHDWAVTMYNTDRVFDTYDTDEVIAPMWSDYRAAILDEGGWEQTTDPDQTRWKMAKEDHGGQMTAAALESKLAALGHQEFDLSLYIDDARVALNLKASRSRKAIEQREDYFQFGGWLQGQGYDVWKEGRTIMARARIQEGGP